MLFGNNRWHSYFSEHVSSYGSPVGTSCMSMNKPSRMLKQNPFSLLMYFSKNGVRVRKMEMHFYSSAQFVLSGQL